MESAVPPDEGAAPRLDERGPTLDPPVAIHLDSKVEAVVSDAPPVSAKSSTPKPSSARTSTPKPPIMMGSVDDDAPDLDALPTSARGLGSRALDHAVEHAVEHDHELDDDDDRDVDDRSFPTEEPPPVEDHEDAPPKLTVDPVDRESAPPAPPINSRRTPFAGRVLGARTPRPSTPAPSSASANNAPSAPPASPDRSAKPSATSPAARVPRTPPPSSARNRLMPISSGPPSSLRPTPRPPAADDGPPASRSLPQKTVAAPHLSPRMTAVFGGLFGLATVASIIALLIQVVPPKDERSAIASASAAASGNASAAPPPEAPKHERKKRTPIPGPWRLSELAKDPSVIIASAPLEKKSFVEVLGDKDVPKAQVYRIMKAFDGVRKFDKGNKHDKITIAMERGTKRVRAFEYEVSPSEIYQAREGEGGLLVASKLDMKISDEEMSGSFYVGPDLAASYQAGGFEDGILSAIDEALGNRFSTDAFEEGSTVKVIAIEETALGLFSRYKKIIALEYRPADPTGKPTRVYSFSGQEAKGYFDERGRQPRAGIWQPPIPGAPVTSHFNPKRMHPVLHKIMPHEGTDFGAATGTPIFTSYHGVVQQMGPMGRCGNAIIIDHQNGITTGYCHMSRYAAGIKAGDKVGSHQVVGYVGQTGSATGPHLHFFAKRDGKFFDAETLLATQERPIPGADRAAFLAQKAELDKRLEAIPMPDPPVEKKAAPAPAPAASGSNAPAAAAGSGAPQPASSGAPSAGPAPAGSANSGAPTGDDDDEGGDLIPGAALSGQPMGPAKPKDKDAPKK
jgi:murein DD-endopeptidase MepM/ murein hydrolase activator NlpD